MRKQHYYQHQTNPSSNSTSTQTRHNYVAHKTQHKQKTPIANHQIKVQSQRHKQPIHKQHQPTVNLYKY